MVRYGYRGTSLHFLSLPTHQQGGISGTTSPVVVDGYLLLSKIDANRPHTPPRVFHSGRRDFLASRFPFLALSSPWPRQYARSFQKQLETQSFPREEKLLNVMGLANAIYGNKIEILYCKIVIQTFILENVRDCNGRVDTWDLYSEAAN